MFLSSLIYGSKAPEISLQSDQKWSLQKGTKVSALKAQMAAMGKSQCISSCNCKTTENSEVFSAFESSIQAVVNIFGNIFFLMNTAVLKFQNFVLKPEVCKMCGNFRLQMDWTCSVGYGLVVNVQKDACFGLSWTLCTSVKICSQFSEIAIFEKIVKVPFLQKCQCFECFSVWGT